MALSAGEKLGPYEIIEPIGKGGMGEVYRARDPRLNRDVAIKVSAAEFTERFEREARAVAALNHPNICQIFDVATSPDGFGYLVMEFVEGEAPKGPLPLHEALRIAKQIAEALNEAHEKGITHRDLKPANIKIRPDGTVKVLDFGLAKFDAAVTSVPQSENSPTLSMAATRMGMILGTAAYMPPEQARGKAVDKRADIWAFGVVLHEILTGERIFQGEDVTETLASVVKEQPKLDSVPFEVRRLLKKCLEKDPKKRLRDIGDVWELLEAAPQPTEAAARAVIEVPVPAPRSRLPWVVATAFALGLAALAFLHFGEKPPAEQPLVRLDVDLGPDVSLVPISQPPTSVVISPDGTRLVYIAGNPPALFLRRLDQPKATELPGTGGAADPFFSPDGQWVGYIAGGKINKISIEGGAVVPLADTSQTGGVAWGEDGSVVFPLGFGKGLGRIPPAGGPPATLTEVASGELAHGLPQILPGGKAVLFVAVSAPPDVDKDTIEVVTLSDRRRKVVVRGGITPHYLPSGHLIYNNKSTLFAVPFDLDKLETRGNAVPILDDMRVHGPTSAGQYDVSRNGTLVYRKRRGGVAGNLMTIQWVDAAGKRDPLLVKPGVYTAPRLSPDGKRVALAIEDGSGRNIWVYDLAHDALNRLTSSGVNDVPVWTPDGRYIVFSSLGNAISWTRSDGAGQPQPLIQSKILSVPWSVTPDGKRLAYMEIAGLPQIRTAPLEDRNGQLKAGQPEQFLKDQFIDQSPTFSLDGRWLAYDSTESGHREVYVRAFPPPASGQGGKWQISNSGGGYPVWSPDRRTLLYSSGDQEMAVNYSVRGDTFETEKPRVWIAKLGGSDPTLSPDGKRLAVLGPVDAPAVPVQDHEVVFLQNFFDELRRKVPVAK
ncbi:MAG TPA: protein kinase [Bryobacteraceae bacterium]|jgi:serine/threonine-protein kinase